MATLSASRGGRRWRAYAALLPVVFVLGCGDGLLGGDYRGPALSSFPVDISQGGSLPSPDPRLRIAIFFSPSSPMNTDPEQMVEHLPSAIPIKLPMSGIVNVFEEPSSRLLIPTTPGVVGFGLGRLLVYDDRDGSGRRDPAEPFVGIDPPTAILFMPQAVPEGQTLTTGGLPAGFRQVVLPQLCGRKPPPPSDANACGVPLGEGCRTDADCGTGYCLRETKFPWPAGYCVITEPPTTGCRPTRAAYYPAPRYAPIPPGLMGFYLRACKSDGDCARTTDRDQGNYTCDVGLQACFPRQGSRIPVGSRLEVEPFCPAR